MLVGQMDVMGADYGGYSCMWIKREPKLIFRWTNPLKSSSGQCIVVRWCRAKYWKLVSIILKQLSSYGVCAWSLFGWQCIVINADCYPMDVGGHGGVGLESCFCRMVLSVWLNRMIKNSCSHSPSKL